MKMLPLVVLALVLSSAAVTTSASPLPAGSCSTGPTLTLHPGLPPSVRHGHLRVPPDLPRGPFTVAVPLYTGAQQLTHFVVPPVPEYPASPYLQTGVAEYQSADSMQMVMAWYRSAFTSCGWRTDGTMNTNASALTDGITFVSAGNRDLTVEMTFGNSPSGGAYIAYAAEEITYPTRPAASYLRGPFSQVRIALRQGVAHNSQSAWHIIHTDMTNQQAIARLVAAINAIRQYYTVTGICLGGLSLTGPAWLSFVRPNGTMVHANERGPGTCGSLAVDGVRWLLDTGPVWNMIVRAARQQQATSLVLPFVRTWHGPGLSSWFRLRGGKYDFSARYHPLGCAQDIAFVGANGYHIADILNFAPDLPQFKGGARWTGWTLPLVAGIYRIQGQKVTGNCGWSVRLARSAR